jgi:RNA polymerase sigma-70 factor (ECF subfamily)
MGIPGVETSDETLAARAASGDDPAFEALVTRYQARVFRLARRLTGNDGDAQDAQQDAFLQVYRNLSSFRGDARFSTWLYRLTMNVARMHLRRQKSRPKLTLAGQDEAGRLEQPAFETPQHEAERNERMRALDRLLGELSEKKREALVLHDFQGVAADEIARILEVPVMTVRTRIFYARRELYAAFAREPALAALVQSELARSEPSAAAPEPSGSPAAQPGDEP